MNIEELRDFCLSKKNTSESFPFGPDTLVFKVHNKMFCLTGLNEPRSINIKCEPEKAIELREQYAAVTPGYHMNKKLWNTILMDGTINNNLLKQWITDSYNLVIGSLPKKLKGLK
jgi:predicted DNA-binding protein (MmcQ/YjbR family)